MQLQLAASTAAPAVAVTAAAGLQQRRHKDGAAAAAEGLDWHAGAELCCSVTTSHMVCRNAYSRHAVTYGEHIIIVLLGWGGWGLEQSAVLGMLTAHECGCQMLRAALAVTVGNAAESSTLQCSCLNAE
jgi:hypothetical protein